MASLTQIAITTRKIIRYSIYAIIFLIIVRITLRIGIAAYRFFFPAPPPPPTVSFGKISKIPFPEKEAPENLTYTLETPEGVLPKLPDQGKVFFIPRASSAFLQLDVAKEKAASLGFSPNETMLTETTYLFTHPMSPALLKINTVTGKFSISYDLTADVSLIGTRPPAPEVATSIARSYLSSAGLLADDLYGPATHEFLRVEGNKFTPALSLSEADFIKVNLYRQEIDEFPSLPANPKEANVWFIISGSNRRERQIIAAEYHYIPINQEQFATYPLKKAEEAWEEIKGGKAYIANPGLIEDNDSVKIRRIYLAYFDPASGGEFYQPIIVFDGDEGFTAYVPAIASEYYGE
jgi:hypothetical protein